MLVKRFFEFFKKKESYQSSNLEDISRRLELGETNIDDVLHHCVGAFGFWQWMVIVLLCLSCPSTTTFSVYANAVPQVRCKMESSVEAVIRSRLINASFVEFKDIITSDSSGCSRYKITDWEQYLANTTSKDRLSLEPCPFGYEYKISEFQYPGSIVSEWDLVCDKDYLVPLGTYAYMIGMFTGFLISGVLGDLFGRKKTGIFFSIIETLFAFLTSFSPNYAVYVIFRSIIALAGLARLVVFVVLPIELTTSKYRSYFISMWGLMQNFFSRALLSILAYLIPQWRILHSVHNILSCLFLLYFFLLPESPRWLISQGRSKEAVLILRRGSSFNKRFFGLSKNIDREYCEKVFATFEKRLAYQDQLIVKKKLSSTHDKFTFENIKLRAKRLWNILKIPYSDTSLLKTSILTTLIFTVEIFTYYGVIYYARMTRVSVYVVCFINASMCIPATFYVMIVYRVFKSRKYPLILCYLVAGLLSLFSGIYTIVVKPESDIVILVCINIIIIMLQSCLNMLYIYVPELYPSDIRSLGFGYAGGIGRMGGAFCIFLNKLDDKEHGLPVVTYGCILIFQIVLVLLLKDTTGENLAESSKKIEVSNKVELE